MDSTATDIPGWSQTPLVVWLATAIVIIQVLSWTHRWWRSILISGGEPAENPNAVRAIQVTKSQPRSLRSLDDEQPMGGCGHSNSSLTTIEDLSDEELLADIFATDSLSPSVSRSKTTSHGQTKASSELLIDENSVGRPKGTDLDSLLDDDDLTSPVSTNDLPSSGIDFDLSDAEDGEDEPRPRRRRKKKDAVGEDSGDGIFSQMWRGAKHGLKIGVDTMNELGRKGYDPHSAEFFEEYSNRVIDGLSDLPTTLSGEVVTDKEVNADKEVVADKKENAKREKDKQASDGKGNDEQGSTRKGSNKKGKDEQGSTRKGSRTSKSDKRRKQSRKQSKSNGTTKRKTRSERNHKGRYPPLPMSGQVRINLVGDNEDGSALITLRPRADQFERAEEKIDDLRDKYGNELAAVGQSALNYAEASQPELVGAVREWLTWSSDDEEGDEIDESTLSAEEKRELVLARMDKAERDPEKAQKKLSSTVTTNSYVERFQRTRRQLIEDTANRQTDPRLRESISQFNDYIDNAVEKVIDFTSDPTMIQQLSAGLLREAGVDLNLLQISSPYSEEDQLLPKEDSEEEATAEEEEEEEEEEENADEEEEETTGGEGTVDDEEGSNDDEGRITDEEKRIGQSDEDKGVNEEAESSVSHSSPDKIDTLHPVDQPDVD